MVVLSEDTWMLYVFAVTAQVPCLSETLLCRRKTCIFLLESSRRHLLLYLQYLRYVDQPDLVLDLTTTDIELPLISEGGSVVVCYVLDSEHSL